MPRCAKPTLRHIKCASVGFTIPLQEVERLADEIVNDIVLEQAQGGLEMALQLPVAAYTSMSCILLLLQSSSPSATAWQKKHSKMSLLPLSHYINNAFNHNIEQWQKPPSLMRK